tara:strand:- start:17 stop:181 length:165 start_codon:yes stop_codon:yes gene_type:complete
LSFDDKKTPVAVSGGTASRSSFDNMVLLSAKNFQLVKFSQENLGIKNPASQRAD